jgi:glycosyltransferase involved in cell wall biosynthesis
MALGKPIVQFNLTEGRFSAGDASLYAIPNDTLDFAQKISQLLDDEPLRRRMGEIGRRRVEGELAWHHQVPELLAAYNIAFVPRQKPALAGSPGDLEAERPDVAPRP